jgi:hypothetical protein
VGAEGSVGRKEGGEEGELAIFASAVDETTLSVPLFGLCVLVDEVERVEVSWEHTIWQ